MKEKAKAYDEALKRAKKLYERGTITEILSYIFPELKESEDEEIRKSLIGHLKECRNNTRSEVMLGEYAKWIAWLEKQGERSNFLSKIQVGDKVTRNEDGVLVNLSQLNRVAKKQGEQKPWSEEDEKMFEHIIAKATLHFSSINYLDEEEINFLKSIKDRVQPKQGWSEEDEDVLDALIRKIEGEDIHVSPHLAVKCLKSLKERYTWKPSDEQMNALNYVVNLMASSERPTENDLYYNILKSLRQQLMKLKG